MKKIKLIFPSVMAVLALLTLALSTAAQQPAPQQAASRFDVTHYRIEAQIIPEQHVLRAGADVTFRASGCDAFGGFRAQWFVEG